jgi:hypothetical protein
MTFPQTDPDFSKPGEDGALPEGFTPWRWAVTYTVHPELISPVKARHECRIVTSVLRKVAGAEPDYAALYERATRIARGRAGRLKCEDPNVSLYMRVLNHGWFRHANTDLARAFVTLGAIYVASSDTLPQGQRLPTAEDFAGPGGMTPDNDALSEEQRQKRVYQVYSEGDVRDPSAPHANIFTLSYGEYVPSCGSVNYGPLVERAEEVARFHFSVADESSHEKLDIVRREWFCATNPDIAVVHLYIKTNG